MKLSTVFRGLFKEAKVNVFSLFLVLALLLWSLIKLSQTYEAEMSFTIDYQNIPEGKTLLGEPIDELRVSLSGTGFRLLKYALFSQHIGIDLNNSKVIANGKYVTTPNSNLTSLQRQFPNETKLMQIKPDSIFVILGQNIEKEIKVELDVQLQFKKGYNLLNPIETEPKMVMVSGREDLVDSLQSLQAEALSLTDLESNFTESLSLIIPEQFGELNFSHREISVKGAIGKFTEGSIKVAVEVINVPDDVTIKLFPSNLEVSYVVNLSRFNEISADNFKVICDFAMAKDKKVLTAKVTTNSDAIINFRLLQNEVQYLIKK
jgi:hypothetical protein